MSNGFDVVAVIVSMISAAVSLLSISLTAKRNMELEMLKNRLEVEKDEAAARRSYQYEARTKLYQEFEPLLFQLIEQSQYAYNHIIEFANMASTDPTRLEILLSKEEEYYFRATLYKFLAPITIFRLMQNHLTTFDLELEPYYKNHYSLAKCVYFSFADYDNISKAEPHINDSQVQTESSKEGVDRGKIDRLADLLLDDNDRVITFGKFEDKCLKPPIVKPFDDFALLFKEFNPHKRRVLWRILIIQAILYAAIRNVRRDELNALHETKNIAENAVDSALKIYVKPLRIFPTLMSPIMYRSLVGVAKAKAGSAWRQKINELDISKLIAEATKTVSKEIKFRDTDDNFRCAENYIKDWLKRYAV